MTNPDRRLSRRDAERLLDDPASHDSALGSALSAARSPARPGELRREELAVASFRRAGLVPPTTTSAHVASRPAARRTAARAVVATGAVVALTSGGFALASSTHLPLLPDRASDRATESVTGTPSPSEASESSEDTETTGATESESTEAEGPTTGPASPTPDLEGLCKAFQATDRSVNGSSLDSAAFRALATAAGGADRVTTYCVDLIGEPRRTGRPTTLPTPTSKASPTGKPSAVPSPTSKPTPAPKPTPTEKPTPTGAPGGAGSGSDNGKSGR